MPTKNQGKMVNSATISPVINDTRNISDEKLKENRSKFQNNEIKSLFCYGDANIRKMIWSLKTDSKFFKSSDGVDLTGALIKEISSNTMIICAPSSSFWQNRKNFDHMHVFIKNFVKRLRWNNNNITYVPQAITPRLNKKPQKVLNKQERQNQTIGAYDLSNYLKYHLRQRLLKKTTSTKNSPLFTTNHSAEILIIDDVKTTGSTLIECRKTVEKYINSLSLEDDKVKIGCLTLAYEA